MKNLYAWRADGGRNGTVCAKDKKEAAENVQSKYNEKPIEIILMQGIKTYEGDTQ